jgi:hypothetical protein
MTECRDDRLDRLAQEVHGVIEKLQSLETERHQLKETLASVNLRRRDLTRYEKGLPEGDEELIEGIKQLIADTRKRDQRKISSIQSKLTCLGNQCTKLRNAVGLGNESFGKNRCPICWSDFSKVETLYSLSCGHVVCGVCLHEIKARCPSCKGAIKDGTSRRLYF